MNFPNRPKWMPIETWRALLAKYDGQPRCARTGKLWSEEKLTVDHILPRFQEGTDDLSNLQFLSHPENSKKGPRDDSYWKQEFYWDRVIDPSKFRCSQRDYAFEMIEGAYRDYFLRPRGEISRLLYLLAWITGSGKTLAIPAITFAYNRLIRMNVGLSAPRADRILVLTKEQAIRDQLVEELRTELTKFGITSTAPRVGVATDGDLFESSGRIDQFDVVVSCVQQLWTNGDDQPRRNIPAVLGWFPLVFVDELHFGLEQILRIVAASDSLWFALTGTPINASGQAIKSCRLFSVYDYQTANLNDDSMKYVDVTDAAMSLIVQEKGINDALVREGTIEKAIFDPKHPAYKYALAAVKTVAETVVSYVQDCDQIEATPMFTTAAPHRLIKSPVVDIVYPMHAMISVDTIHMAQQICEQMNHQFNSDRRMYPLEKGYITMVVCSDHESLDGKKVSGQKLLPGHPWLMYKETGQLFRRVKGKTEYACRFIVSVGMLREGTNNPYLGVIGVGKPVDSLIEAIQRWLGRLIRAVVKKDADGTLHVAPERLDTPKIISHKAWDNVPLIREAINYVVNMADKLSDIPPICEKDEEDTPSKPLPPTNTGESLSSAEKLNLAAAVVKEKEGRLQGSLTDLIDVIGGDSETKCNLAQKWVDTVRNHPDEARSSFVSDDSLPVIPAVMRESPTCEPTEDTLMRFLRRHMPECPEITESLHVNLIRMMALKMYEDFQRRFHIEEYKSRETLEDIRRGLATSIQFAFTPHVRTPINDFRKCVFSLVGGAVKKVLGVPPDEKAKVGSDWDKPQYHVILRKPDVRRAITYWVQRKIIRGGHCPDIAKAFDIPEDYDDEPEEE